MAPDPFISTNSPSPRSGIAPPSQRFRSDRKLDAPAFGRYHRRPALIHPAIPATRRTMPTERQATKNSKWNRASRPWARGLLCSRRRSPGGAAAARCGGRRRTVRNTSASLRRRSNRYSGRAVSSATARRNRRGASTSQSFRAMATSCEAGSSGSVPRRGSQRARCLHPMTPAQPLPKAERERLVGWMRTAADYVDCGDPARRDPGPAPLRRLSRVEYDNTIRDLLGIPFDSAREVGMPVDDGGAGGFDNLAASLGVSPALIDKYFAAAEKVVDAVFAADGNGGNARKRLFVARPGPGLAAARGRPTRHRTARSPRLPQAPANPTWRGCLASSTAPRRRASRSKTPSGPC